MSQNYLLSIAQSWQQAANDQDIERLLALSDTSIEIVGPRGTGIGHQLLREWLARAGLKLTTRRAFVGKDIVVLQQHGIWETEQGQIRGEAELASVFKIEGEKIMQLARYDNIEGALEIASLSNENEIDLLDLIM